MGKGTRTVYFNSMTIMFYLSTNVLTMAGSTHRDDLDGQPRDNQGRTFSQGPSPPPRHPQVRHLHHHLTLPVFQAVEQHSPAVLLQLLLVISGIETNPGPTWYCTICKYSIHHKSISIKCNKCKDWCHLKCTDLKSYKDWHTNYVASCCNQLQPNIQLQPNNSVTNVNPSSNSTKSDVFKILQFNCRGISNKCDEILNYMHTNHIKVAAIQETKLSEKSNLTTKDGYNFVRHDRTQDEGGGLAFIVHNSIPFQSIDLPSPRQYDIHLEQQAIKIKSNESYVTLVNLYIPPRSSCAAGYRLDVSHLLQTEDSLILGDFNAHHGLWFSAHPEDQRGEDIATQIDQSPFGVLNENTHTRLAPDGGTSPLSLVLHSYPLQNGTLSVL